MPRRPARARVTFRIVTPIGDIEPFRSARTAHYVALDIARYDTFPLYGTPAQRAYLQNGGTYTVTRSGE